VYFNDVIRGLDWRGRGTEGTTVPFQSIRHHVTFSEIEKNQEKIKSGVKKIGVTRDRQIE